MSTPILGAVLAGGLSRRFGRDKTAVNVGGVAMIERTVDALRDACEDVVVVSSRAETPEGDWRIIPDLREGRGPLAGIEAALMEAGRGVESGRPAGGAEHRGPVAVFVLAADLPLVGPDTVRRLVDAYTTSRPPVAAVAAARRGQPFFEPLCAVYSVACSGAASALLDSGRGAAQELFVTVEGVAVDVDDEVAAINVNTEEDRERAEARLRAAAREASAACGEEAS